MPKPNLSKVKGEERNDFVSAINGHLIDVESTLEIAINRNALYFTEKRDIRQAIKRLKELITRIR